MQTADWQAGVPVEEELKQFSFDFSGFYIMYIVIIVQNRPRRSSTTRIINLFALVVYGIGDHYINWTVGIMVTPNVWVHVVQSVPIWWRCER